MSVKGDQVVAPIRAHFAGEDEHFRGVCQQVRW